MLCVPFNKFGRAGLFQPMRDFQKGRHIAFLAISFSNQEKQNKTERSLSQIMNKLVCCFIFLTPNYVNCILQWQEWHSYCRDLCNTTRVVGKVEMLVKSIKEPHLSLSYKPSSSRMVKTRLKTENRLPSCCCWYPKLPREIPFSPILLYP